MNSPILAPYKIERKSDQKKLTHQQLEVYQFIRQGIEKGNPPTTSEIRAKFGWKSWENAHRVVKILINKGYLLKKPRAWRGFILPPNKLDSPPYTGYYWYYPSAVTMRKPVEIVLNGNMELEQVELGTCQRRLVHNLGGKWEFISK